METVITKFEAKYRKPKVTEVRTGDTVRVHQTITEAGKKRVQVFEGMVILTRRKNSLTSRITVRRIASGIGVEKSFFLHSPNIVKVEVTKRTKVRRNFLSYMRARAGKSTRLAEQEFDKEQVNVKEQKPETKAVSKEEAEELAKEAEAEKAGEKEAEAAEAKDEKSDTKSEAKAEDKSEKAPKDDKAAEKKAKAEEFRKAQEAKK